MSDVNNTNLAEFAKVKQFMEQEIRQSFPITSYRGRTMSVDNLHWENNGDRPSSNFSAQKDAKLKLRTFDCRLVGDVEFKDAEGNLIERRDKYLTIAIPQVTDKSSFIINGTEVQPINQVRLRPGIYSRIDPQGLVEAHLNTSAAGSYKVLLDRKTNLIRFKVGSDKKLPIYSVLRSMGVNDLRIKELLGPLYADNKKAAGNDTASNSIALLKTIRPSLPITEVTDVDATIKSFFESKPLDPGSTRLTVGKEFSSISAEAIMAAVKKIIDIGNGAQEEDDKESLAFKTFHSYADLLIEKVQKSMPGIINGIKSKMDKAERINAAMLPGLFGGPIYSFLTTSELSQHSDQNNPLDIISTNSAVTMMGEGGIQSTHAVTHNVRMVHPSQYGALDVVQSPEGQKIGITLHRTSGAIKTGNTLSIPLYDIKAGKYVYKTVEEGMPLVIAFPDQYEVSGGKLKLKSGITKVKVRNGNQIEEVRPEQVTHVFGPTDGMMSESIQAIPFLNSNSANRLLMSAKHTQQTAALVGNEQPLVQVRAANGKTVEENIAQQFCTKSPVDGTVTRVAKDKVTITTKEGQKVVVDLHQNYPLNGKAFLNDTASVKAGDTVKKGQIIADNNFTNKGVLALGKNLKMAFMAYKGHNFEDGIVVSESAAKKLTSIHKNDLMIETDKETTTDPAKFLAFYPQEREFLDPAKFDGGVIKKGTIVHKGDIVIPGLRFFDMKKSKLTSLHKKSLGTKAADISIRWEKDVPGTVVDVVKTAKITRAIVESSEPLVVGDKLSSRASSKGIVTYICPDSEMYRDGKGEVIDILFNPFGVTGRINPGLMFEAAAGKIAQKTKKPFITKNFDQPKEGNVAFLQAELKKNRLSDEETVTDPVTGRKFDGVMVGPVHVLKLKHNVSDKIAYRGAAGEAYTSLNQPKKVSGIGAQGTGALDTYSLLSGGGTEFLKDAFSIKSTRNDEYWTNLQLGRALPAPASTYVSERLIAELISAGVNLDQEGSAITASPLTDKEILHMSNGPITRPAVVRSSDLREEPRGLFDKEITGGHGGTRFSHINLAEPVINPIMRPALQSVLGVTGNTLDKLVRGEYKVREDGTIDESGKSGVSGGNGIKILLQHLNVDDAIKDTELRIRKLKNKADSNPLFKRAKFLTSLKKYTTATDQTPDQVYLWTKVPVIPPKYRPISEDNNGNLAVSDANHGYREIIMINTQLRKLKDLGVDDEHLKDLRSAITQSVAANSGLDQFVTKGRKFKGFLENINGSGSSKYGFFKSKVMSRPQDLSARSTIIVNPDLHMDEIGIPKDMAMKIYEPFVIKSLVQNGYAPTDAKKMIEDKRDVTISVLKDEMSKRPVLMNRAPSLHKFSVIAQKGRLIDGKAIEISPLVVGGLNADFDGDSIDLETKIPLKIEGKIHHITGKELEKLLDVGDGNWITSVRGIEAFAYDKWVPVSNISFHVVNKRKFRVTLKNGFSLIVSEDHSLMSGKKEITPLNLTVGSLLDNATWTVSSGGSYDRGVAYGHFLGDGCVCVKDKNKGSTISIACKPELERNYLANIWKNEFNVNPKSFLTEERISIYSKTLGKEILSNCGKYAGGKFIGPELLSEGEDFLKGVLAGYILADGSVEITKSGGYLIRTWSNSKDLRDGMALIASMLGLSPNIRTRITKSTPRYIMSLGKEAIKVIDYRCPGKKFNIIKTAQEDYISNRKTVKSSQSTKGFCVHSIEEVEYNDRMIDIEIADESHVFTVGSGLVVHNTVGLHVPVSEAARKEALEKLMPSSNLMSVRDESVMPAPSKEAVLGIYLMTTPKRKKGADIPKFSSEAEAKKAYEDRAIKANDMINVNGEQVCYGQFVYRDTVGTKYYPKLVSINGNLLDDTVIRIAKEEASQKAADLITAIKDLGNKYVTEIGHSVALKDLLINYKKRDNIMNRAQIISENKGFDTAASMAQDELATLMALATDNSFVEQTMSSQANRKGGQLRQMIATPVAVQDHKGRTVPFLIRKSYAEGHDMGTFFATIPGSRQGLIDKGLSVADTGTLNRLMANASIENTIIMEDCKTTDGITLDVNPGNRSDIVGRVLAGTREIITPASYAQLVSKKTVKVRSPLTCKAGRGICAYCFGLLENGKLPEVGYHVGTMAAQTLGERATQTTLQKFHTGSAVGSANVGFDRIKELVNLTRSVKHQAVLSTTSGTVDRIDTAPAGGWFVHVGTEKYYVPKELGLAVSLGDIVNKGTQLDKSGAINVHDYLAATGDVRKSQDVLVNGLKSAYGKQKIYRKIFETVVKPMTTMAKVIDAGDALQQFGIGVGDVVPSTVLEGHNRTLKLQGKNTIEYEPIFIGTRQLPNHADDFIGALAHERLRDTLLGAATLGKTVNKQTGTAITRLTLGNAMPIRQIKGIK